MKSVLRSTNTDRSGNEQYKEIDRTVEAVVSDLEVRLEVVVARSDVVEVVVEHPDAARPPARAVPIQDIGHVHRTVDVAEVLANAPAHECRKRWRLDKTFQNATRNDRHVSVTAQLGYTAEVRL